MNEQKTQLTEEQLQEATRELKRREDEKEQRYHEEWYAKQQAAEEKFWAGMLARYPQLDRDTMYDIYGECRDFYDY
jgi:hypothetical protein